MRKRTGKKVREQGVRDFSDEETRPRQKTPAGTRKDYLEFRELRSIDELLAVFADYGEEIDAEAVESIFARSGKDRLSVLDVTAELIRMQKGGVAS